MKILFLSLLEIHSLDDHNIYSDLLREFVKNGHEVYAVSPVERRYHEKTHIISLDHCEILRPAIGNIQKTNLIEKGMTTLTLESRIQSAIRKYWKGIRFDLILYSTPPITLTGVIQKIKNRDHAKTYLMLKDIFPQNALDMGMLRTSGLRGLLYRYFRGKEKHLYEVSDRIGCMSPANAEYLIRHNPQIPAEKVEICPNAVDPISYSVTDQERRSLREKYGIPQDRRVFVYGGNLGRPQCVPFIIECIRACRDLEKAFFLVAGSGTDYHKLTDFVSQEHPKNLLLLEKLPVEEYNRMVAACDAGLIFLDHRFTIPNFPSRLLSYMQAGLPVLACTDSHTDVGQVITDHGFGWWCESTDAEAFAETVQRAMDQLPLNCEQMQKLLNTEFSVRNSYQIISRFCENGRES